MVTYYTFWSSPAIKQTYEVLSLSQPVLSVQLRTLENSIGEKLFARLGRKLVRTDVGSEAYRYVEEIFTLGQELTNALKGRGFSKPVRLVVWITEAVTKNVSHIELGV